MNAFPDFKHERELVEFAREQGAYAVANATKIKPSLKAGRDDQVVTFVDKEIDRRARARFGHRHHMVGEESVKKPSAAEWKKILLSTTMLVDPIDGTSCYVNRMGNYGITLGIYYKGVPIAGTIYLPEAATPYAMWFGEKPRGILVYAERVGYEIVDGQVVGGEYVGYRQLDGGEKIPLSKEAPDLGLGRKGSFFGVCYRLMRSVWTTEPIKPWHTHAFVSTMVDLAVGRLVGTIFMDALYDKAGAMPIWMAMGWEAVNMETKVVMDRLIPSNYKEEWQIKVPHLLCHPAVRATLEENLVDLWGTPHLVGRWLAYKAKIIAKKLLPTELRFW